MQVSVKYSMDKSNRFFLFDIKPEMQKPKQQYKAKFSYVLWRYHKKEAGNKSRPLQ